MPEHLTSDEAEAIGRELIRQREQGVPWKILVWRYGLCRARLNQLWRVAIARTNRPEKMSIDIATD